jgi:delta8-fatty-acid desaturase
MFNPLTSLGDAPSSSTKKGASSFVPGRAADGAPIMNSQRPATVDVITDSEKKQPLLVGVRGDWYDVTNFLPYHPGGDVILEFVGRDATAQFMAYHSPRVLANRKPVGNYDFDKAKPGGEVMQGDWMRLSDKYEQLGYYDTPLWFVWSRVAIIATFLSATLACVHVYTHGMLGEWVSRMVFVVGAICLAGFWQQSGFLMHDTMHNLCFHNRHYDQMLGWFCGNIVLGLSSKWWRDEHNEHHLFTNTAVDGVGASDPQMIEDAWIQDVMLDQFYHPLNQLPLPHVKDFLIKYQHVLFVPLCMIAGPYHIKIVSLVNAGPRPMEYFGIALHFTFVHSLLSCFDTWSERFAFYGIAMFFIGVLSIQLLVSHYGKPWVEKETVKVSGSWAKRQVESIVDIDCPLWLDWFHGGLHLHSPHHLFPRLPRCYYRQVHKDVLAMCKNNGVELSIMPWFDAVAAALRHLKHVGEKLAAKDGREKDMRMSLTKPKGC